MKEKYVIVLFNRFRFVYTPIKILPFILLFVLLIVFTSFYISNKKNEFKTTNNPVKAKEVAEDLAQKISKIYQLPKETPTIATIVDVNVLPKDPFYQYAKEGDKILIFPSYQQIILYRPSENKVINVGSIEPKVFSENTEVAGTTTQASQSGQTETATTEQSPKVIFQPVNQ